MFKTPIALFIFNRPDITNRIFIEISKIKPSTLLLISDGARESKIGECEKVDSARKIVDRVNWPCTVLKNYSDSNLGCKKRISSGIDWVFENVEKAIFLEDDCLPDPTFFRFCEEMLLRYQNNQQIGMISGDNFQFGKMYGPESYYFSKYCHVWGWATWKDRWTGIYDVNMEIWPRFSSEEEFSKLFYCDAEHKYWHKLFQRAYLNKIDTWDIQWTFVNWAFNRLTILPNVNLISNLGFDMHATHTKSFGELANMPTFQMNFPLKHPIQVVRNIQADIYSDRISIRLPVWKKIKNRITVLFR